MHRDDNRNFALKAESLVKPEDVTPISFLGDFNRILPPKAQETNMRRGSMMVPYMGFIVDPYCFFLAYEIKDRGAAAAMLPTGYELADARVFKDGPARPLVVVGAFAIRTSAFIGTRLEFYVIARRRDTGRLSWIIAGYETNTSTYDPKNHFSGYSADPGVLTTTPYGEVVASFRNKKSGSSFFATADLARGAWKDLDRELWVDGNWSIDYGGALKVEPSAPFSLLFDPEMMNRALEMPEDSVTVRENGYFADIIDGTRPLCAAVFPYSQHFVIKQDLEPGTVTDETRLGELVREFLDDSSFKRMSGDDLKKPIIAGLLVSGAITYGIIIALALALILR